MTKAELYQKACMLPLLPGVYIIRDKSDTIIYIGKAKRLRIRVSQYFREGVPHDNKVSQMIAHAYAFDVIVCQSEFEALVLEATSMGLGTCWLGAGFYPDIINRNVDLQTDEAVHCVISIGKANLPAFAPKRKELVKVCGMDEAQLGQLGAWQKEAVLAARLAPSAINQQPWKIVADKTSVSILETTVLYKKYAPLDRGICMLHAAVGAAKAGRTGLWKKVDGGYAMKA